MDFNATLKVTVQIKFNLDIQLLKFWSQSYDLSKMAATAKQQHKKRSSRVELS